MTAAKAGTYTLRAVYGMKEVGAGNDGSGGTPTQGKLTVMANGKSIENTLGSTSWKWGSYVYEIVTLGSVELSEGENTISLSYAGETELGLDSLMLDLAK